MKSIIYGPVASWRLGRSLGIDLIATEKKTCSFNCTYCQLGRVANPLVERREFVPIKEVTAILKQIKDVAADYATFSGMGEPTLASNLGQAIQLTRTILHLPVAVLTNSSLMPREDVRQELAQADVVVAKIDASSEELFHQINSPQVKYTLNDILQAIKLFRTNYRGKLALQMMFMEANKNHTREMARIARELQPDEVQINTPLRPSPVKPLTPEEIATVEREFSGLKRSSNSVYLTKAQGYAPELKGNLEAEAKTLSI